MTLYPCYRDFFDHLPQDAQIITPNYRLSRFVAEQYALYVPESQNAWLPLSCTAIAGWVANLTRQLHLQQQLISDAQANALWLEVCQKTLDDEIAQSSFIDAAKVAYNRLRMCGVDLAEVDNNQEETQLLLKVIDAYEQALDKLNLVESTAAVEILKAQVQKISVSSGEIFFLGFDDLAPAYDQIIQSLKARGAKICFKDLSIKGQVSVGAFESSDAELKAAINWAYKIISENKQTRIGIVVPNLANLRPKVERFVIERFEPNYCWPNEPQHAPAFNISAGQPLAQTPLVQTALNCLSLNLGFINRDKATSILASPFIWDEQSSKFAEQLIEYVRTDYLQINVQQLSALTAKFVEQNQSAEQFHKSIRSFIEQAQESKHKTLTHSQWLDLWCSQLLALGWPGVRQLDTLEFQQFKLWQESLKSFAGLDQVLPPCKQSEALNRLSRHLYTPFLAQTATSPLQILGLLEASGTHFDALWVTGLNDRNWPEPCQPNPILPVALQKKHQMPRASVEREFVLAQKITQRLAASAQQVIFSYPKWNGDEPLNASTLLNEFTNDLTIAETVKSKTPPSQIKLEIILDGQGSPIAEATPKIRGGSAVLKDQAACAFRAYIKHRLHAQKIDEKRAGVSPLLRGNLIHTALENLWAKIQTSDNLNKMSDAELNDLVNEKLQAAWFTQKSRDIGERSRNLELARAHELIMQWLMLERKRAPFKVETNEKAIEGRVGPLNLSLRLDRLDKLSDGSHAVIDYKTGKAEVNQWLGERPDEPQVPLYCVLQNKVTMAVFGQLSVNGAEHKGLTENEELWPGLKTVDNIKALAMQNKQWRDLLTDWQRYLENLAEDFYQGVAIVNPKNNDATCRFCDLQSVCRIGVNKIKNGAES